MSWIRIDDKHNLRNPSCHDTQRVFGWKGKLWPRISLSVYDWSKFESHNLGGKPAKLNPCFKISCSYKKKGGYWWEDCATPRELLPHLVELLGKHEDDKQVQP